MKIKMIALTLFIFTIMVVSFYPLVNDAKTVPSPDVTVMPGRQVKIEAVFVLDTTGSMGGLIQAAKEKIWSIASTMASAQPTPEIKIGFVAYRDRGDEYITQVIDLSADLDSSYARLMDLKAEGGGDGPESVNQALYEAVQAISWSRGQDSYKVIFLVGDAPPHMDYQDDVKYPQTLALAQQQGIVVNTIQCGQDTATTPVWRQLAQLGSGRYFQVEQSGSAVAVATPFDKKIAELSAELDKTRLYYGNKAEKARQEAKVKATEKLHAESSVASRARRGVFNATAAGAGNFLGTQELIDDVTTGRIDLSSIDNDALPEPMQTMGPEEQREWIAANADKRHQLQKTIRELADQRDAFIAAEINKNGDSKASLDDKIYSAVREQAEVKGLQYDAAAPIY